MIQYNKAYHSSNIDAAITKIKYGLEIDTDFIYKLGDLEGRFDFTANEFKKVIKEHPEFYKRNISRYNRACFEYLKENFDVNPCWTGEKSTEKSDARARRKREYHNQYYQANKERITTARNKKHEYQKQWYQDNKEYLSALRAEKKAYNNNYYEKTKADALVEEEKKYQAKLKKKSIKKQIKETQKLISICYQNIGIAI